MKGGEELKKLNAILNRSRERQRSRSASTLRGRLPPGRHVGSFRSDDRNARAAGAAEALALIDVGGEEHGVWKGTRPRRQCRERVRSQVLHYFDTPMVLSVNGV